jgi:hypothetical protein
MSALGQKQTFAVHQAMSALPPFCASEAGQGVSLYNHANGTFRPQRGISRNVQPYVGQHLANEIGRANKKAAGAFCLSPGP